MKKTIYKKGIVKSEQKPVLKAGKSVDKHEMIQIKGEVEYKKK